MSSASELSLDTTALRSAFPALSREHEGRCVVYLDGPGGSQVPAQVIEAMADYLRDHNANTDGPFPTSAETDTLLREARHAAADFLGCGYGEVVFGANTTTINFLLAHAVARTLEPGDEIVVTELDHDANVAPWLLVARDHSLIVRTLPLRREDATLALDALDQLVGPRTKVVACTGASNAVGSVTALDRVAAAARAAGALLWVDAVHLAPHRRLDFAAIGADVLLTSPYKYFGPHMGVAAVREDLARTWPADRVRPADEEPPGHRFETGTLAHEAVAGFLAALAYLEDLGRGGPVDNSRRDRLDLAFARIAAHEGALTELTLNRLAEIDGLTLFGITDPARSTERTPTFSFNLAGWSAAALSAELAARGLFTYHGNYYALGAMTALGLQEGGGAVRAGYLHYTTPEEADRLCRALEELSTAARLSRRSASASES
jgi:cysteine desulfurase family protein (TIGR01976 family)